MNYRVTYQGENQVIEQKVDKRLLGLKYSTWEATSTRKLEDAAQAFRSTITPPPFDVNKHIEHAFTYDGVDYYHFPNPINMTPVRFGYFMFYMNESSMKCTREFLLAYTDGIEKAINSSKIDLMQIASLTKGLRERLNLVFIPDLVYKQASILYFDKNEDPEDYDYEYNQEKIKKWKKGEAAFFLETPVKHLILSDAISEEIFPIYLTILEKADRMSTREVLQSISPTLNADELKKYKGLHSLVTSQ